MEVMRRVALFLGLSLCGLPALGQGETPREPEVHVRDIAFTGNTFVSGPVLRVQLTTRRGGLFVHSQVDADTDGLRAYYRSFGFHEVKVSREFLWDADGKAVGLVFHIAEGPRHRHTTEAEPATTCPFSREDISHIIKMRASDCPGQEKAEDDARYSEPIRYPRGELPSPPPAERVTTPEPSEPSRPIRMDPEEAASTCARAALIGIHPLFAFISSSLEPVLVARTWSGGMTVPSAHYLEHPPTYCPESPPFPYAKELAVMQEQAAREEHPTMPYADDEPRPTPTPLIAMAHNIRGLMKVYDVVWDSEGKTVKVAGVDVRARELIASVETVVAPKTWQGRGGSGSIEFNPRLKALVVMQTEDVQAEVARYLRAWRQQVRADRHRCEKEVRHSKQIQKQQWENRGARNVLPGLWLDLDCYITDEQSMGNLLAQSHEALLMGKVWEADWLARRAREIDPARAHSHPLALRLHSLRELLNVADNSDVGPCWVEPHENTPKVIGFSRDAGEDRPGSLLCGETDVQRVDVLLQRSREALRSGWRSDAEILARQALAIDAKATLAHPLVSQRDLLKHALSEDDPLARWLPPSRIGVLEDNQFGIWGE